MVRKRLLTIVVIMIALAMVLGACGRGQDSEATDTPVSAAEEVADEVADEALSAEAEVEADVEADTEEAAAEVSDTEAAAEETVEEAAADADDAADAVATEEPEAEEAADETEAVGEEAAGEAEAEMGPMINVTSETFIGDVIGNNNPSHVTLSTSGDQLVWPESVGRFWNREGELCIYTFESAATECAISPDIFEGYPYAFFWSPDDAHVAFTENPIQLGYESDIWVFNPESQEYVDLTDDGVQGDWISAEPGSYTLDYLPMWNHQDGDIYFWRSIPNPNFPLSITLSIMSVAPTGGEAELVRELQDIRGGEMIWFNDQAWFMDGVSALSPDGRYVAVLAFSEDTDTGVSASDGLFLIDLEDESVPPRHLVTAEDFQMALPSWTSAMLTPSGLSWHADSEQLVVLAQFDDGQQPIVVLYDVDIADGALIPVVDFSDVPDIEAYTAQPDGVGVPPRGYSPWTASMSPENDKLLMYQNIANVAGLMVSPLPPTGDLPGLDYESQIQNTVPTPRSSRSEDGKVLMYNILFNLAPQ